MKKLLIIGFLSIGIAGCQTAHTNLGTVLGAAGGGYAGSQIGGGKGKTIATIAGSLLGAAMGNHVGSVFDGVGLNRSAINRNHMQLHQLRQQQNSQGGAVVTPMMYPQPYIPSYTQPRQNNLQLNCRVVNNYVRCDGS